MFQRSGLRDSELCKTGRLQGLDWMPNVSPWCLWSPIIRKPTDFLSVKMCPLPFMGSALLRYESVAADFRGKNEGLGINDL